MIAQSDRSFIGSTLQQLALDLPEEPFIFVENTWLPRRRVYEEVKKRARILNQLLPKRAKVAISLAEPLDVLYWFLSVCVSDGEAHVLAPEWPLSIKEEVIERSGADLVIDEIKSRALLDATHFSLWNEDKYEPPIVDPEAVFYVGFTSGSTSLPKGYRRTHRSWLKSFDAESLEFGLTGDSTFAAFGPLSHSLGLYAAVRALHTGARLILLAKFEPKKVLSIIRSARVSVCYAAPSHLKLIEQVESEPLETVRLILSSGAKWYGLEDRLSKMFPQAELAEFYGTSELSFVSVRRRDDKAPQTSVGRPFAGVKVTVRDEMGTVLAPGKKGRIFVESDFVFESYLNERQDVYRMGRALSVGDVGWLDQDGFLFLDGRENRMIVSAGKNVFPEALEARLLEHPSVDKALVVGVGHQVRGELIVALVVAKAGQSLSSSDLKRHLAKSTPRALIPRLFAEPIEWRLTHSGKVDVNSLMQDLLENRCRYLK